VFIKNGYYEDVVGNFGTRFLPTAFRHKPYTKEREKIMEICPNIPIEQWKSNMYVRYVKTCHPVLWIELIYCEKEQEILDSKHLSKIECQICCKIVIENNFTCNKTCIQCLREHCKVKLEEGEYDIQCPIDNCCILTDEQIIVLLDQNHYEIWQRRMVKSLLKNFEQCPFCDCVIELEDVDEPLFRCLKEECLRISCRHCKLENHSPHTCEEWQDHLSKFLTWEEELRKKIEELINNQLIAYCPGCKIAISRTDGCNFMACTNCKTYFCYTCKESLTAKDHSALSPHYAETVKKYDNDGNVIGNEIIHPFFTNNDVLKNNTYEQCKLLRDEYNKKYNDDKFVKNIITDSEIHDWIFY
jgi:TRIAD3 protein (E3 ubiquitin-protein ligase RNF216)